MWRVILLVFCYHVVSQPVTDESTRHTRELIECCPCPGSGRDVVPSGRLRASADDCPCRSNADAEGASSIFFPTRRNPDSSVPFMRSNDPDDTKNLLEPEVGLATSMLQTLREATEEEYQDALARDAARSSDAVPEESARNVVIIVKPRTSYDEDDFVPEASNVKETRCINPVGSSLGKMRTSSKPLRTLPDFFRLPKAGQPSLHRNLWDMDSNVGASNTQPNVVDKNGGIAEIKPLTPLFKFRTPLKENAFKSSINSESSKMPSVFVKLEQTLKNRPNLFERFNLSLIPKMKVDSTLRNVNNTVNRNNDLNPAQSNIQQIMEKENDRGIFKLSKRPPMLKNLLKLKDVELISKPMPKIPMFKSKLNTNAKSLQTHLNRDADDKCRDLNYDSSMNEEVVMPNNVVPKEINDIEVINNLNGDGLDNIANDVVKSEGDKEIQDAITSPSEILPNIYENALTYTEELEESGCNEVLLEEIITTTTEIIPKDEESDGSNATLDPAVESEIFEEDTEDVNGSTAIEGCETSEVLEIENTEPDMNSGNSIKNIIPLTSQNSEDSVTKFEKPEQDTINLTENNSEDFNDIRNAEDRSGPETSQDIVPNIKPYPHLSDTLSTIKDNVRKSLENLKKTTQNVIPSLSQNNKSSSLKTEIPITEELVNEADKDDLITNDSSNSKEKENLNQVTFKDLQKLSDDLLVLSSNNKPNIIPKEAEVKDGSMELQLQKSNESQNQTDETDSNYLESEPRTMITVVDIPKDVNIDPLKGKMCQVNLDESKEKSAMQIKSVVQDENRQDMLVEASAPVANTLPSLLDPLNLNEQLGSSLIQNIHPLDPLNLNEKLASTLLPSLDPLNLNEKLRSTLLPDSNPLNLNEKFASPMLPNLDPLNLNLGTSLIESLNVNENLESLLQPNLDPLNVRSTLQNIIVQPSVPDEPLNILGKPIADVFKLPTLEDIRQRLSTVFETNDRSAENNFSDEEGDCSNDAPLEMIPAASTSNLRKVPSIKPLENSMNLDIFNLNPLPKSDILSNVPRLNLNNFRAKLPTPNNLDLKPVKLDARIGNNVGNVLGGPLTFFEKANSRNVQPNSKLLGHPLGNLPSLDDLRNTFHSSTQSLLGTPLHPSLDLFRDSSLRSNGIPDIDEIRRNAEKTMKGLHQRMKSTLQGKVDNPLGEKFARPQDLLEDVNDKLKALHYDFSDRLSSIHEDILDQSRLKHLAMPTLPTFPTNRNANRNKINNIRKGKPARLQASPSTMSSQQIDPFQNTNDKSLLRSRNNLKRVPSNTDKTFLGSESSSVPIKTEFANSKIMIDTPKKSMLSQLPRLPNSRQGSDSLFPQNSRGKPLVLPKQSGFTKDLKPIIRKASPFKDKNSKVTITFATTTPSPVTSPMNQFGTTPIIKHDKLNNIHIKPTSETLRDKVILPKLKTFEEGNRSAGGFAPPKISNPINSKTNFKTASSGKDHPQLQSLEPIQNSRSKLPNPKEFTDQLRLNKPNARKLDSSWPFDNKKLVKNVEAAADKKVTPLVWPKSGEDSFLTKVREAMQARLKNFNPTKAKHNIDIPKVEGPNTDMIRSASENNDIIIGEPIKENVPYKCRMLCSRE